MLNKKYYICLKILFINLTNLNQNKTNEQANLFGINNTFTIYINK